MSLACRPEVRQPMLHRPVTNPNHHTFGGGGGGFFGGGGGDFFGGGGGDFFGGGGGLGGGGNGYSFNVCGLDRSVHCTPTSASSNLLQWMPLPVFLVPQLLSPVFKEPANEWESVTSSAATT